MINNTFTVCVTGHRPDKLYGYNLNYYKYDQIRKKFENCLSDLLQKHQKIVAISGMALGIDSLFVQVCEKMIENGANIEIICAVPCTNQSSLWQLRDKQFHADCLSKYRTEYITNTPYTANCMEKRNRWMVDRSDMVISWWNGSSGGTRNCINYAKYQNIPVVNLA